MRAETPEGLATTVQKTHQWLNEIMTDLAEDEHVAYRGLRAVLHALRDRLPVEEAAHLGSQLPMLVRGLYYDGWSPNGKPLNTQCDEFLEEVRRHFPVKNDIPHPERVVRSVFGLLARHVSAGEVRDVCSNLPADLRDLWPKPSLRRVRR